MAHGHRKLTASVGTLAVGGFGGVDVLVWTWGILAKYTGVNPMPESVAVGIVALLSNLALYFTKEDDVGQRNA